MNMLKWLPGVKPLITAQLKVNAAPPLFIEGIGCLQ